MGFSGGVKFSSDLACQSVFIPIGMNMMLEILPPVLGVEIMTERRYFLAGFVY